MERSAIVLFILFSGTTYGLENRLERELNFVLGKENKAPLVPRVVTYESWKGDAKKDENGMIEDSTSTSLAAPVRSDQDIIVELHNKKEKNRTFKPRRKRSR